jgi:hypothetical protein
MTKSYSLDLRRRVVRLVEAAIPAMRPHDETQSAPPQFYELSSKVHAASKGNRVPDPVPNFTMKM